MALTKEQLAEAITMYQDILNEFDTDEDKAKHTMEACQQVADHFGELPNSIRLRLVQAGVWIKTAAKKATSSSASGDGKTKRVNKAEAIAELSSLISANGYDLSDDDKAVIEKLTGKAALMFTGIISTIALNAE